MAAGRKLQAEVEKVLKKVEEGIEEFNNVWDNVHSATHANQREKFEAELKTQIKKLQRDREQIKTWQSDKSIKDKNSLADARKKIEVEMERFKEFERDAKTKTYSKEGLSKSDKVDPYEEERNKHRQWMQEAIDKLNVQCDELDADLEAQSAGSKKGKAKTEDAETIHLKHVQETHRWHATKLEQIMRKLENDEIPMEELEELKDTVEYYVDEAARSADEFQPFDTIYDAFGLEDVEDYLAKDRDRRDSEAEVEKDADSAAGENEKVEKAASPTESSKESSKKDPSKRTGGVNAEAKGAGPGAMPSPTMRPQRSGREEGSESAAATVQKPWPPMVSVWQNLPMAQPKEQPAASPPAPSPPKTGPSQPRPMPSLPPPMQPAPERPPPPGQAPVLNSPPNQPPPKPAPHAAPPHQAPPHQPPQMQPPTQAPPQPPLPSPPMGSPPRPQGPPPPSSATVMPGTLAGLVSTTPMPPPPAMAPPAPQDVTVASSSTSTAPTSAPPAAGTPATGAPSLSDPPMSAPPPPPPPLLPPPPPAPAPAPGMSGPPPPATTPSLPPVHAKKPAQPSTEHDPPAWPPPTPYLAGDDRSAPKMPPPSEAPPPPTESPPPPPLDGPGMGMGAEGSPAEALAAAAAAAAAVAAASSSVEMTRESAGLSLGSRVGESSGLSTTPEAGGPLSPRKLHALNVLVASHQHLPLPSDSRRNRKYVPRNPYVHLDTRSSAAYPTQPTRNYDDPAMFEKYDLDTLFFIFYYQQGSYQQHLAAKELKKLSWRYHTKYLTWFQRHEEPRCTASDFERGAYVYFDHDSGWCQRIKSDFTFEYQFLEDEPM